MCITHSLVGQLGTGSAASPLPPALCASAASCQPIEIPKAGTKTRPKCSLCKHGEVPAAGSEQGWGSSPRTVPFPLESILWTGGSVHPAGSHSQTPALTCFLWSSHFSPGIASHLLLQPSRDLTPFYPELSLPEHRE